MATIAKSFTDGADSYTVATADDYFLIFLDGADTLTVKAGSTIASMGEGNDIVSLRAGLVQVAGEAGDDRFDIYSTNARADGGSGSDLFSVRGGTGLTANGGIGDDRFDFGAASSGFTLNGGDGNDQFLGHGLALAGMVRGDAGIDRFSGFLAGTSVAGGADNDVYTVDGAWGATIVEAAGGGTDTANLSRGRTFTLPTNLENVIVATLAGSTTGAATITGNASDNRIAGHGNVETIAGGGGNDRLYGNGGNDTLGGGDGNDLVDGGAGNDTLTGGAGTDVLVGRTGDDAMSGGAGNDSYYVDSNTDTITELDGEGTDTVRTTSNFTLSDFVEIGIVSTSMGRGITGNAQDNLIVGNAGADGLLGLDGNDDLRGGGGADQLAGFNGDDLIDGGIGADVMAGGPGNDKYVVDNAGDTLIESVDEGGDSVTVNIDNYILPNEVEGGTLRIGTTLTGNASDNSLIGNAGNNVLNGLDGFDALSGMNGNDTLNGGAGADVLNGNAGNDRLNGGGYYDQMVGEGGVDTFDYDALSDAPLHFGSGSGIAVEVIFLFQTGSDKIDLSGIDADTGTAGDQAFVYIGGMAPTGVAGQLWMIDLTGDGFPGYWAVQGDVNGNGLADFEFYVESPTMPAQGDFVL